jgi:alanine racemase
MSRPAKITIDLAAIQANYDLAKALAPSAKIMAVVKADAYGHGSIEVAKALAPQVELFAVSCLEEALVLRQAGVTNKILLLEGFFDSSEVGLAIDNNCEFILHNDLQIRHFLHASIDRPLKTWLKIDTGMHRLGIEPSLAAKCYSQLMESSNVNEVVLVSHLACADNLFSECTTHQINTFQNCVDSVVQSQTVDVSPKLSLANSAGVLAWPDSRLDWLRPGIMLYGLSPFAKPHPEADKLTPAMNFESEIISVRELAVGESVGYGSTWTAQRISKVATIAVGYGDGYPRTATSGTPVLVNGQRVPLVGRVSMDLISVDVTDLDEVKVGDPVVLWGKALSANEVASYAGTIGYELVTRMPNRVKHTYINA